MHIASFDTLHFLLLCPQERHLFSNVPRIKKKKLKTTAIIFHSALMVYGRGLKLIRVSVPDSPTTKGRGPGGQRARGLQFVLLLFEKNKTIKGFYLAKQPTLPVTPQRRNLVFSAFHKFSFANFSFYLHTLLIWAHTCYNV